MYDVHLGLIGKRVVDFLLIIIQLFTLDVTAPLTHFILMNYGAI